MNLLDDQHRLISHGDGEASHWSLLQRLNGPNSHKREIWKPILTHLSHDQAQRWLARLSPSSSSSRAEPC